MNFERKVFMGAEEKSLKVYDTRRTFFSKIGSTLGKILTPTKLGFNNLLVSMKRSSMIKNYKNMIQYIRVKRLSYLIIFLYLSSLFGMTIMSLRK